MPRTIGTQLGKVLDAQQLALFALEFGYGFDYESEVWVVDNSKIFGLGGNLDCYYILDECLLICKTNVISEANRVLYYAGAENEAELSLFSKNKEIIAYRMEDDSVFKDKLK